MGMPYTTWLVAYMGAEQHRIDLAHDEYGNARWFIWKDETITPFEQSFGVFTPWHFHTQNSYIYPNVKMSLHPRNSNLRYTFTRFFRKVPSDLDLRNNVLIFVSDIQVISTI